METSVRRLFERYERSMARSLGEEPKIFGWVTGDEQALLRKHGII
ncbi:MAG: hypothetical protein WA975_06025 [Mesorhizobium sp.]